MSIELTNEQLQASASAPVRLTDPRTNREYVLVPAEVYGRAKALFDDFGDQQLVQDMYQYMAEVFGKAGWDDPAMDVYNEPPKPMSVKRGDFVLLDFPFASGSGMNRLPALVVQNDKDNYRLVNSIVAQFTSVTHRHLEATQLLVEVATPEGRESGLKFDSAPFLPGRRAASQFRRSVTARRSRWTRE